MGSRPATENLDPAFSEGVYGIYGGPDGARVVVSVFEVAEGMNAIRTSWELANGAFDNYRNQIEYGFDVSRERDLAELPLPDGCADGRRIYGVDKFGIELFPVGLELCAADPNILVLVYASGTVAGMTGYEAADAVTEIVLSGDAGGGSPEADN